MSTSIPADFGERDFAGAVWLRPQNSEGVNTTYFRRVLADLEIEFYSDMATIFQRFDVPYQED